jgi:adenosylcobyric acid synthase
LGSKPPSRKRKCLFCLNLEADDTPPCASQLSDSGEIHAGESEGPALDHPAVILEQGRRDGAISADGRILGTYLHGLFERPSACATLLRWAGLAQPLSVDHPARREQMLERLADAVERSLDVSRLLSPLHPE